MWNTCCTRTHRVPWAKVKEVLVLLNTLAGIQPPDPTADLVMFYWSSPQDLANLIRVNIRPLCNSGYQGVAEHMFRQCNAIVLQQCFAVSECVASENPLSETCSVIAISDEKTRDQGAHPPPVDNVHAIKTDAEKASSAQVEVIPTPADSEVETPPSENPGEVVRNPTPDRRPNMDTRQSAEVLAIPKDCSKTPNILANHLPPEDTPQKTQGNPQLHPVTQHTSGPKSWRTIVQTMNHSTEVVVKRTASEDRKPTPVPPNQKPHKKPRAKTASLSRTPKSHDRKSKCRSPNTRDRNERSRKSRSKKSRVKKETCKPHKDKSEKSKSQPPKSSRNASYKSRDTMKRDTSTPTEQRIDKETSGSKRDARTKPTSTHRAKASPPAAKVQPPSIRERVTPTPEKEKVARTISGVIPEPSTQPPDPEEKNTPGHKDPAYVGYPKQHVVVHVEVDSVIYVQQYLLGVQGEKHQTYSTQDEKGAVKSGYTGTIMEQSIQTVATRHPVEPMGTPQNSTKQESSEGSKSSRTTDRSHVEVWVQVDDTVDTGTASFRRICENACRSTSLSIVLNTAYETDGKDIAYRVFRLTLVKYKISNEPDALKRTIGFIYAYPTSMAAMQTCAELAWGKSKREYMSAAFHDVIKLLAGVGIYDHMVEVGLAYPNTPVESMTNYFKSHAETPESNTPIPPRLNGKTKRRIARRKKKKSKKKRGKPNLSRTEDDPARGRLYFYNATPFNMIHVDSVSKLLQSIIRALFSSNADDANTYMIKHLTDSSLSTVIPFRYVLPLFESAHSKWRRAPLHSKETGTGQNSASLEVRLGQFSENMTTIERHMKRWKLERERIKDVFYHMPSHWTMKPVFKMVSQLARIMKVAETVQGLSTHPKRRPKAKPKLPPKNLEQELMNRETIRMIFETSASIGQNLLDCNMHGAPLAIQKKMTHDVLLSMISSVNMICGVIPEELSCLYTGPHSGEIEIRNRVRTVSSFIKGVARGIETTRFSSTIWCTPSAYLYTTSIAANILNVVFEYLTKDIRKAMCQYTETHQAAQNDTGIGMHITVGNPETAQKIGSQIKILRINREFKILPCNRYTELCKLVTLSSNILPQSVFSEMSRYTPRQIEFMQGMNPADPLFILRITTLAVAIQTIASMVARTIHSARKFTTERDGESTSKLSAGISSVPKNRLKMIQTAVSEAIAASGIRVERRPSLQYPTHEKKQRETKTQEDSNEWKRSLTIVLSHIIEITMFQNRESVLKRKWKPSTTMLCILLSTIASPPSDIKLYDDPDTDRCSPNSSMRTIRLNSKTRLRSRIVWAASMISDMICQGDDFIKFREMAKLTPRRTQDIRDIVHRIIESSWITMQLQIMGSKTPPIKPLHAKNAPVFPSLKDIRFTSIIASALWSFANITNRLNPTSEDTEEKSVAYFAQCERSVSAYARTLYGYWSHATGMNDESKPVLDIVNAGNVFGSTCTKLVRTAWFFGGSFRTEPDQSQSFTKKNVRGGSQARSSCMMDPKSTMELYKFVILSYIHIKWIVDRGSLPIGNFIMPVSQHLTNQMNADMGFDTPCSTVQRALEAVNNLNAYVSGFSRVVLMKTFRVKWEGTEELSSDELKCVKYVHHIMSPLLKAFATRPRQYTNRTVMRLVMALLVETHRILSAVYVKHPDWVATPTLGVIYSQLTTQTESGPPHRSKSPGFAKMMESKEYPLIVAAEGLRNLIFVDLVRRYTTSIESTVVSDDAACIIDYLNQASIDIEHMCHQPVVPKFKDMNEKWEVQTKKFAQYVTSILEKFIIPYIPSQHNQCDARRWMLLTSKCKEPTEAFFVAFLTWIHSRVCATHRT